MFGYKNILHIANFCSLLNFVYVGILQHIYKRYINGWHSHTQNYSIYCCSIVKRFIAPKSILPFFFLVYIVYCAAQAVSKQKQNSLYKSVLIYKWAAFLYFLKGYILYFNGKLPFYYVIWWHGRFFFSILYVYTFFYGPCRKVMSQNLCLKYLILILLYFFFVLIFKLEITIVYLWIVSGKKKKLFFCSLIENI